jgi:schlafen family protein
MRRVAHERSAASNSEQQSPKSRYILQSLLKGKTRLLVALIILTIVFAAVAVCQHWFVHSRVYGTAAQELAAEAQQIAREIAPDGKWDLKHYRNSIGLPGDPSAWYILRRDGLAVDIIGFIPGVFGRVSAPEDSIFRGSPTAVEETWRLLQTPVGGGYVILGIASPEDTSDADSRLKDNAKRFGSTLAEAISFAKAEETSLKGRQTDDDVDYAVISSDGELKAAWGGVPLTDMSGLSAGSEHVTRVVSNGKPYLLYFRPIVDNKQHQPLGMIIVPKDISLEEQALLSQDVFNLWIVGITGALAVATILTLILRYEFEKRSLEISLEEALQKGEGQSIEFKSSIHDEDLAKLVAAFANSDSGNIFVGVADNGGVTGLPQETLQQRDALLRRIQQAIKRMVQPPVVPTATFIPHNGRIVLRLFVPRGGHPPYVVQGTVWIRRLAEVVAADREEIIERAIRARRSRKRSSP